MDQHNHPGGWSEFRDDCPVCIETVTDPFGFEPDREDDQS